MKEMPLTKFLQDIAIQTRMKVKLTKTKEVTSHIEEKVKGSVFSPLCTKIIRRAETVGTRGKSSWQGDSIRVTKYLHQYPHPPPTALL